VEGLILVTHHFAEITEMYSQVVLMHQGRILVQGTREEILRPDLVAEAFDCSPHLASQELPPRISA
jgi:ABC-type branched-subunit amino acid transport system ATPase component